MATLRMSYKTIVYFKLTYDHLCVLMCIQICPKLCIMHNYDQSFNRNIIYLSICNNNNTKLNLVYSLNLLLLI